MIRKYRERRPHYSQKVSIKRALEAVDRHALVSLIMPEETEKNTNAFEKIMDNEKSNVNGTIDDNDVIKNNNTNVEQATKLENCDVEENVHDIEQPHVSSQSDEMQN